MEAFSGKCWRVSKWKNLHETHVNIHERKSTLFTIFIASSDTISCVNSHKRVLAHINTQLFIVCTIFHLSRVFIRKFKTVSKSIFFHSNLRSTLKNDSILFFSFFSSLAMIIFHHRRAKTWVCRARTNGPVWAKKANWTRHTAAKKKRETRTTCGSRENSKYEIEERKICERLITFN